MIVDGRRYDTSALSGGGTRWTSACAAPRASSPAILRGSDARPPRPSLDRLALARREIERIADLVAATGLSRRAVQEALREPPTTRRRTSAARFDPSPSRGWKRGSRRRTAISITSRPPRRPPSGGPRWLHETYWLDGAHLICVGDRDLTTLAVATVNPGVQVSVVDVDERVLEAIRAIARERRPERADRVRRPAARPARLLAARPATSRSPTRPTRPRASSCSPRGPCRCCARTTPHAC